MRLLLPAFALFTLTACDVENVDVHAADPANTDLVAKYHEGVGAPIDSALGVQWIDNHRRTGPVVRPYTVRAAALRRALAVPDCVGITLRYSAEAPGGTELVPLATDREGQPLTNVDRLRGTVRSHFFGRDTFTRLLDERRIELVRATPALDDEGRPQLLLSDAADEHPRVYEDRSNPPTDTPKP